MTLRLILTRHAKSDWDNPLHTDHERPLNARGRKAAPRIGRWLVEKGYLPQQALVSDAVRTKETWALLRQQFPHEVNTRFLSALYQGNGNTDLMLDVLSTAESDSVILIGHNPGIGGLAAMLVREPPEHEGFGRYPTCATLVVEFDAESWSDIRPGTGNVRDFVVPRQIVDD